MSRFKRTQSVARRIRAMEVAAQAQAVEAPPVMRIPRGKGRLVVEESTTTQVFLTCTCECGSVAKLTVTRDGWERYAVGGMVQDCFPELNADDRERIISGTCNTCWDAMYGGDA